MPTPAIGPVLSPHGGSLLNEHARPLAAARREEPLAYAAVCLACEGGLRVGEAQALRWREDVELVAGTITVKQQMLRGIVGTPKGRYGLAVGGVAKGRGESGAGEGRIRRRGPR